jgi:hypothetical protein
MLKPDDSDVLMESTSRHVSDESASDLIMQSVFEGDDCLGNPDICMKSISGAEEMKSSGKEAHEVNSVNDDGIFFFFCFQKFHYHQLLDLLLCIKEIKQSKATKMMLRNCSVKHTKTVSFFSEGRTNFLMRAMRLGKDANHRHQGNLRMTP